MNRHSQRLTRLEDARRQSEPLRLDLVFAEDLKPGEQPALTMTWPEDEHKRTAYPFGSTAQDATA